jgi:IS5 family transposase
MKKKREERCRSRAGVEGLISHLKLNHRMLRNYLKGTEGDKINTLLAAAAYNMKKWMVRQRAFIFVFIRNIFFRVPELLPIYIQTCRIRKIGY